MFFPCRVPSDDFSVNDVKSFVGKQGNYCNAEFELLSTNTETPISGNI